MITPESASTAVTAWASVAGAVLTAVTLALVYLGPKVVALVAQVKALKDEADTHTAQIAANAAAVHAVALATPTVAVTATADAAPQPPKI